MPQRLSMGTGERRASRATERGTAGQATSLLAGAAAVVGTGDWITGELEIGEAAAARGLGLGVLGERASQLGFAVCLTRSPQPVVHAQTHTFFPLSTDAPIGLTG